jgi:hypothetical protein
LRLGDEFWSLRGRGRAEGESRILRVDRILTYGRYLNQLDSGLTAELALRGEWPRTFRGTLDLVGHSELPLFDSIQIVGRGDLHVDAPVSTSERDAVSAIARCHPALALAVSNLAAEWQPEPVPATVALGALGRTLVGSVPYLSDSDIENVGSAVEDTLSVGGAAADAVATGFIESICALSVQCPGEVRRIVEHLGAKGHDYIRAWDTFTGTHTPGRRR